MIKNIVLLLLIYTNIAFAGIITVPNDTDYIYFENKNFRLIFTPQLFEEAKFTLNLSKQLKFKYDKSFGYKLDEKLNVGLLSSNNQFANGFSTQAPFNMQMNYIGGTEKIDYFSSASWLEVLIYHETAHNYQMNAKNNSFSKYSKKILGNNLMPIIVTVVPFFTIPNMTLPQFITEGNATMNESWHGNGGRLFSGRAYALLMTQIKHKKINPDLLINTTLEFPYSEEKYLIGGYFWLCLAEKYGIKKTNGFFVENSKHFINPFRTNKVFKNTFGITFYDAVNQFVKRFETDSKNFIELKGRVIGKTKSLDKMNRIDNEILFVTRNLKDTPVLHILNTNSNKEKLKEANWLAGKPFKYKNKIVTASSYVNGTDKITQGLYDKNAYLIKNTGSKMVQDINDSDILYFDVKKSFVKAKLYLNNKFYNEINSSAIFDTDKNIYYFKQKGKKRILYKNKQPLISFKGFYGFVTDIDKSGIIYFIAPSKYGSSLYAYDGMNVYRISNADNILDAKIINDKKILASTVNAEDFEFIIFKPEKIKELPYEFKFFFEKNIDYSKNDITYDDILNIKSYSMIKNLKFSNIYPVFSYDSSAGMVFKLDANFIDPLMYNQLSFFIMRNTDKEYSGGISYLNTKNLLEYSFSFYGIDKKEKNNDERSYGGDFVLNYPLYKKGRNKINTVFRTYLDDEYDKKNPVILKSNYKYSEKQYLNMYSNLNINMDIFGKYDRDDYFTGADMDFLKRLPYDFYIGANFKYIYTDVDKYEDAKGIKITNDMLQLNNDITTVEMLGLSGDYYSKNILKAGITIKKQFNFHKYFFTFPISLRRESLYVNHNYFNIKKFDNSYIDVNETTIGATFDLLFFNIGAVPLSIEYIYNDTTKDKEKTRITFNFEF